MPVRKKRGFVLLELLVVLLIATLLATLAASTMAERIRDAAAQASAAWMLSVTQAARSYVSRHALQISLADDSAGQPLPGYERWAEPTLAEFKADGLLSPGFPETDRLAGKAVIRVLRDGVCPGSSCQIEVLVYSAHPLASHKLLAYDPRLLASWLLAAGGQGGAVRQATPQFVSGAAFRFANPPAPGIDSLPVGTVAMAVTRQSLGHFDWLRQYDDRDPYFQGPASIAGPVSLESTLDVAGYLSVRPEHFAYTLCLTEGAISREYYGGLLVCRAGRWRSAAGAGGGGYSVSSLKGCTQASRNPVTDDCSCPLEYYPVLISDNGANSPEVGRVRGYLCVGD